MHKFQLSSHKRSTLRAQYNSSKSIYYFIIRRLGFDCAQITTEFSVLTLIRSSFAPKMSFFKIWKSNSKHTKLNEEYSKSPKWSKKARQEMEMGLTESQEQENEVLSFQVKYIGSSPVERASSEATTAEAIKSILRVAKAAGNKLPRVHVEISRTGIRVTDAPSADKDRLNVSIYRISYCSADATNNRVFAFIATDATDTMECHAFLCPKRKLAQAVTLSLARAFGMAYEQWSTHPTSCQSSTEKHQNVYHPMSQPISVLHHKHDSSRLIDFGDSPAVGKTGADLQKNHWVSFDDEESQRWSHSRGVDLVC